MNSLPRWLSRKDKKKKITTTTSTLQDKKFSSKAAHTLHVTKSVPNLGISELQSNNGQTYQGYAQQLDHQHYLYNRPPSGLSTTDTDSVFLNPDTLYVNGQVPRGQFREYFSISHLDSYIEDGKGENYPSVGCYGSVDLLTSSHRQSTREMSLNDIGSPNSNGLPTPQQGVYYNVQFARTISVNSARESPDFDKTSLTSEHSVFINQNTGTDVNPSKQGVTDDNYDEVDTAQADMLAARQAEMLAVKQTDITTSTADQIMIGQSADVLTYKKLLNGEATSDRDSLSRDSGQTGSLEEGNHYGTPRPSGDSSVRGEIVPGQHPSSEGKRRRNRSNVEAMAAKHLDTEQENKGGSPDSGVTDQSSLPKQSASEAGEDDPLGPLPHNWEKAFTDKGEPYFIDHSTGTSHWLDPRLSRVQKLRPEDCEDNELPFGWERIDDPHYGTYYIDHVNRRTQYENPVLVAKAANQSQDNVRDLPPSPVKGPPPHPSTLAASLSTTQNERPFFTRDPGQLKGEKIQAKLVKSSRGLGFTIVGGDDSEEEFLQIKSVVANGPAWLDGRLKTGDVLVYVNGTCVLGFTHHDMVTMFQNINPGEVVKLEVCRGYPLPFDPDDPNTEIVTTVAVNSPDQTIDWSMGGGGNNSRFLRSELDSTASMPDLWRNQSSVGAGAGGANEDRLRPGSADLLMDTTSPPMNGLDDSADGSGAANQQQDDSSNGDRVTIPIVKGGMGFGFTIADSAYGQKVKKILDRPRCKSLQEGDILVEINDITVQNMNHNNVVQVLKDCARGQEAAITIQRGYSLNLSKNKFKKKDESGGMRPKSGFLFRSKTPTAELFATQEKEIVPMRPKTPIVDTRNMSQKSWPDNNQNVASSPFSRNDLSRASLGVGSRQINNSFDMLADQMGTLGLKQGGGGGAGGRSHSPGRDLDQQQQQQQNVPTTQQQQQQYQYNQQLNNYQHQNGFVPNGYDSGYGYSGYNGAPPATTGADYMPGGIGYSPNGNTTTQAYRAGSLPRPRKDSSNLDGGSWGQQGAARGGGDVEMVVTLRRHDSGFGFRIVGGTEEGSQVSIGHIVPGGAADMDGRLFSGDEIMGVDGQSVVGASHHVVVGMMGNAAQRGQVQLTIRRRQYQEGYPEGYPYDVTVSRLENEGFGFVIISSVSRAGSTIGRIIPGSPAERCGRLHVGDRILAVNHVDINSLHHEKIINIIKESGYSVTLTVGPPIDDSSSTASTSHREDQEVGAHLGEDEQYFAVELGRGNRGFGFSIRGGREFHSMPLFVLRMAVDGPAAADGRLRVGDQLIEINGQSTRNMTHAEAIETIKNGGATVRLLVKRGKAPPPAILDQMNLVGSSVTPLPQHRPVSSLSQPAQYSSQYAPPANNQQQYAPPNAATSPQQASYSMNQSYTNNNSQNNFSMNSSSNINYSMNSTQSTQPYLGGGVAPPPSQGGYTSPSGGGGGQEQPVSHSSPRYPPGQQGYLQQPYWGYHQQSVE